MSKIEHESNLYKYKEMFGYTWEELAIKLGYSKDIDVLLCGLSSGAQTPLTKKNKPKTIVNKLMKLFNVKFEDLFPRYSCKLTVLVEGDISTFSEFSYISTHDPEEIYECIELCRLIDDVINNSDSRNTQIFLERMGLGRQENANIGREFNISRERVRQILNWYDDRIWEIINQNEQIRTIKTRPGKKR